MDHHLALLLNCLAHGSSGVRAPRTHPRAGRRARRGRGAAGRVVRAAGSGRRGEVDLCMVPSGECWTGCERGRGGRKCLGEGGGGRAARAVLPRSRCAVRRGRAFLWSYTFFRRCCAVLALLALPRGPPWPDWGTGKKGKLPDKVTTGARVGLAESWQRLALVQGSGEIAGGDGCCAGAGATSKCLAFRSSASGEAARWRSLPLSTVAPGKGAFGPRNERALVCPMSAEVRWIIIWLSF